MTADDKYSVRNRKNLTQPIQQLLSKKQKKFSQFFATCLKSKSNVDQFEKKMTFKGYVFSKLETAKDVVK